MVFRTDQETESLFPSPNEVPKPSPEKLSVAYTVAAIVSIHMVLIGCAFIRWQHPVEAPAVPAPELLSNGMPLP